MKVELRVVVLVFAVTFCGVNIFVSRGSIQLSPQQGPSAVSILNVTVTTSSDNDKSHYHRQDEVEDEDKHKQTNLTAVSAEVQHHQQQHRQEQIRMDHRVYWRYDEAGLFHNVTISRSHWLPSIPSTRKIPMQQAENVTYHLQQRTNLTTTTLRMIPNTKGQYRVVNPTYDIARDYRTLYLYNPSVVAVPYGDGDVWGIRESFSDKHDNTIAYVATFRLYLGSNCFGPNKDRLLMKAGEQINYLGVALLDASLHILYDAVLDINAGPLPTVGDPYDDRTKMHYWDKFKQPAEDCRIFNVGKPSLALICNAIHFQIQLRKQTIPSPPAGKHDDAHTDTRPHFPYVYPNLYGETLQVVLVEPPTLLIQGKEAKNMNVFYHEASGTHYLQVYPHPHWYQPLFNNNREDAALAPDHHELLLSPSFDTPDVRHTIRASMKQLGRGTNQTIDEQPFFAVQQNDQDRGTACCVTVQYQGRTVRVGIAHTKLHHGKNYWTKDRLHRYENATYTYGWNRYLSRFVAYELDPPFAVVAVSGWFCLGFGGAETSDSVDDNEYDDNPLAGRNTQYRLDLFDELYDCPAIHFASGIAETVDDPTKAIIAYGVNDCYPRIIVVNKQDIERKLDPPSSHTTSTDVV